jgi:hypothetical protein
MEEKASGDPTFRISRPWTVGPMAHKPWARLKIDGPEGL